ncbi:MAG: hypothetical protein ACXABY_04910 [Candidatus Thorarchaeota archaeon]|jgi:hypothetical protein
MRTVQVTAGASASGLDPEVYKQSGNQPYLRPYPRASISVENGPIRFRTDSQDPTATFGTLASSGSNIILENAEEVKGFRFIRSGGSDALLTVAFEMRKAGN